MVGRKLIAGVVVTALLLGGVGAAAVMFRPDRAIRVGTGFVAHNLCVKAFVSGLDPQAAFAEIKDRAGIRRMRYLLGYHLDATARTVEVATLGFFGSRAAFHEGQGSIPPATSGASDAWSAKSSPRSGADARCPTPGILRGLKSAGS